MGISRRVASTRRRALRVRARAHAHDRFFRTDRAAARRTNAPIAVGRRFESRRAPFLSHPHACDARRTMVSLNARRNERSSSNKASEIINGFLSSPVRVFYSILFICALEVLLWSVVLVPGRTSGAWNDAARAYYTRETVNLSSAYGASVRVPIPAIDLRSLALAWRQESSWQQKALSVVSTALLPSKAQQTKQSLQARLRHLDEQLLIGGTAESGASEAAAANAKVFSLSF